MEALGFYLLKVHISITLLYAAYHLFLKDQLYFRLNRWVLVGIMAVALLTPLLPEWNMDRVVEPIIENTPVLPAAEAPVPDAEISKLEDEIYLRRVSGIIVSLVAFYLVGFAFYMIRFGGQLMQVVTIIRSSKRIYTEHGDYYNPEENGPAFSFFGYVVLSKNLYGDAEFRRVMAHENAHVQQLHSADILAAGLVHCILWLNPLAGKLKDAVKLNLEFLADQQVLRDGFDKKAYQWSILSPYLVPAAYPVTNAYGSSPKQRIEKMNAIARPAWQLINYLVLVGIGLFIYVGVSPLQAAVLQRIDTIHLIDEHAYRDYLGYYEMENDKGTYVQVVMKNDSLVMKTLWNNQKIPFRPYAPNAFFSKESDIMLSFPRDRRGGVKRFVACGDDNWQKVERYIPEDKKTREGVSITRGSDGGLHVAVYVIEPWANVKNYTVKKGLRTQ